jgi:SPX domain protein involved in polyphosphate accumulation
LLAKEEVIHGLRTLLAEKDVNLKRLYIEVEDLRVGLKRKEEELKQCDDEHQEHVERLQNEADEATRLGEEQAEALKERIRAQRTVLTNAKAEMDSIEV